ncbi:hypothetical protein [Tsukamurella paurometabola]|uniref:SseB protein N-terminal domain-containing protein n=1 Tax=Tsukamurella paurometabola TaxID=2061 RepID=A0ABS5NEX8_TSUPA|nr:hypothetical protein [Tsukamurella paurometabola]MBS4102844.1 hypothetical protein [Tsukamurella paurometabola]
MRALSRVLLRASAGEAAEIVAALSVLAGFPDTAAVWLPYTSDDGIDSVAATIRVGETTVDVVVGERAAPVVLEVTVPDLPAAVHRAVAAGAPVTVWPALGDLETVTLEAGGMQIDAISEAALIDRRGPSH